MIVQTECKQTRLFAEAQPIFENLFSMSISGFFSTLSEFVHGLSTSNLMYEKTTEDFEPIYGVATSLIGKLQSMLSKLYMTDLEILSPKLISALLDEGMPQQYVNDLIKRFLSKS